MDFSSDGLLVLLFITFFFKAFISSSTGTLLSSSLISSLGLLDLFNSFFCSLALSGDVATFIFRSHVTSACNLMFIL